MRRWRFTIGGRQPSLPDGDAAPSDELTASLGRGGRTRELHSVTLDGHGGLSLEGEVSAYTLEGATKSALRFVAVKVRKAYSAPEWGADLVTVSLAPEGVL